MSGNSNIYSTKVQEILKAILNEDGTFTFRDTTTFGDASNYTEVNSSGVHSLVGTAKRSLVLRPALDFEEVNKANAPTAVTVGSCFHGFSMPVYNDNNEELFYRQDGPRRWDGESNPMAKVTVCLADTEDADDSFKLEYSWNHICQTTIGARVPSSSHDITKEITIEANATIQYSTYLATFLIDYDIEPATPLIACDVLGGRIRRLAADGTDIDNELIVLDHVVEYTVDKMFGDDS